MVQCSLIRRWGVSEALISKPFSAIGNTCLLACALSRKGGFNFAEQVACVPPFGKGLSMCGSDWALVGKSS